MQVYCHSVFYIYQKQSLVRGPVVQENCLSKKKVGGLSQDEFVEYNK